MAVKKYDCVVIGDWHLAFVTSTVLAHLGYRILMLNPRPMQSPWTGVPNIPVHEPGLSDMLSETIQNGRLDFCNHLTDDFSFSKVWLAVDTPVDSSDMPDTSLLDDIARAIANLKADLSAFIISSQVPLGFCAGLSKAYKLPVVYIPENLRLGKGIDTFLRADRTVVGARNTSLAESVKDFLSKFETEFLLCDLQTAEMVKHANNAFLATSISFANELARLGEHFGVDNLLVAKALKLDRRIGEAAYVMPGLGFAGGTLPRDVRTLARLGLEEKIPMRMMSAVLSVNEDTTKAIIESVILQFQGVNNPRVLILGYTYKAETNTLRRSLSIEIAKVLRTAGTEVFGYDPIMNSQDLSELSGKIDHLNNLPDLKTAPHIILLMTARPEFLRLPWAGLLQNWAPRGHRILFFDTQNFLSAEPVLALGMDFKKLWGVTQKATKGNGQTLSHD